MSDATEGQRIYAIGDVHGRCDLLDGMLQRIDRDLARRPHIRSRLVFVGDYTDRGSDSQGVLARLAELKGSKRPATFLLGNHDAYILTYLEDPHWRDVADHWLFSLGGAETLASYGVSWVRANRHEAAREAFAAAFPAEHLDFLKQCLLTWRAGGYLFVHAGLRPGVPLERQRRKDLLWIRDGFLSSTADFGFKVVHGHTVVPKVEHHRNRIAIDTGAVRTGVLSCLVLEGGDVALLEPEGPAGLPEGSGVEAGLFESLRNSLRSIWPGR